MTFLLGSCHRNVFCNIIKNYTSLHHAGFSQLFGANVTKGSLESRGNCELPEYLSTQEVEMVVNFKINRVFLFCNRFF